MLLVSKAVHVTVFVARWFTTAAKLPTLTLFTKRKELCSLCEVAKEDLKSLEPKFVYEEVYIDDPGNIEWNKKYRFDIPVIHVNGKLAMKHRVDKQLLEQIIHNAQY